MGKEVISSGKPLKETQSISQREIAVHFSASLFLALLGHHASDASEVLFEELTLASEIKKSSLGHAQVLKSNKNNKRAIKIQKE